MQLFLPHADFKKSARDLDVRRLGKQRLEILELITFRRPNHPCARAWRGHEYQAAIFGLAVCDEWIRRGYKDTQRDKIREAMKELLYQPLYPSWFGKKQIHDIYKGRLISKSPDFYSQIYKDIRSYDDLFPWELIVPGWKRK